MQAANPSVTHLVLGVVGAIVGGCVGGVLFVLAMQQGFYMLALPGAAIGLSCGYLSKIRSLPLGIFCAVFAAGLGIWLEWSQRPFKSDDSFSYFVSHLHQLTPVTQIMWVIGVLFGFWFGMGRESGYASRATTHSN